MNVVGESCVIVTDAPARFAPPLRVSITFGVVNVAGLIGSENVTSTELTGPLCGLMTCVTEETSGGSAVVGR